MKDDEEEDIVEDGDMVEEDEEEDIVEDGDMVEEDEEPLNLNELEEDEEETNYSDESPLNLDELGDDDISGVNLDDLDIEENNEEDKEGGGPKKERKMWVGRIEERDNIFDKFKYPEKPYSKTCPSSQNRQPVIVTKEELDNINSSHEGSYFPEKGTFDTEPDKSNFSIKFHTKKENDLYYICPKFWCLDENVSLNIKKDLKLNPDGSEYRNKDGNVESNKPGFCKNIYEFGVKYSQASDKDKELIDKDGNLTKNAFYYPSFKDDNYCLPCCYKYSDRTPSNFGNPQEKADNCMKSIQGDIREPIEKKEKEQKSNPYTKILSVILQSDKFPLPEFRSGYLNVTLKNMFKFKNMVCDVDESSGKKFDCHLRIGVEESSNQSFVSAMAAIYKFAVNKGKTIKSHDFKEMIVNNISIDHFISLQNGNLISMFNTSPLDYESEVEDSIFYQKIDKNNKKEMSSFKMITNSFIKFKKYFMKDDVLIDHTIMWDLVCGSYTYLFENGMNLVIFESTNNDGDNYVKLLCPSNYYSSMKFDLSKDKGTVFLVKIGSKYEPIARITTRSSGTKIQFFQKIKSELSNSVSSEYELIKKVSKYYDSCYPIPSIPSKYNYGENILRMKVQIENYLIKNKYQNIKQVVNYRGKVIGLYAEKDIRNKKMGGVVPCYPGFLDVSKDFVFHKNKLLHKTYDSTLSFMTHVFKESKSVIYLLPPKKVLYKEKVVGFMTPLNHFIQIFPFVELSATDDKLETTDILFIGKEDELMDTIIYENRDKQDTIRDMYIKKIKMENFIFTLFRQRFKMLLEKPDMIERKSDIISIIETVHYMYKFKMEKIKRIIKDAMEEEYIFVDKFTDEFMEEIDLKSIPDYIVEEKDNKILVPSKNLITGRLNKEVYFDKLSDELIRFPSLRKYILDPKGYIEAINDEQNVNDDEIIIPESTITREMLLNIRRWSSSKHPHEIGFDAVQPQKSIVHRKNVDFKMPVTLNKNNAPVLLMKSKGGSFTRKMSMNKKRNVGHTRKYKISRNLKIEGNN